MTRFGTLLTSTVVAALMSVAPDASGQARGVLPRGDQEVRSIATALHGSLEGVVLDDVGAPVSGATVSALGVTSALAITDRTGRFRLYGLPAGPYLLRAHYSGYIPSRRQFVEVRPSVRTTVAVSMRRTRVLAAGLGSTAGGDSQANDDHSDTAWYLRHVPRSVLKDTTEREGVTGGDTEAPGHEKSGGFARPTDSTARFASLFTDLPVTGQVNLLTASSFASVDRVFSADTPSSNVAALSVGGPVGALGDWSFQGITAQGDLGTWFLSGSFRSRAPASHLYDVNIAYSTQRFSAPGTEFPRAATSDSRAVGTLYAVDRWQASPQLAVIYGTRYSRYDYVSGPGLFSPHAQLVLRPTPAWQIETSISRNMLAPGAEEFLPPLTPGLWVPAERTFDWLSNQPLTAERANNYELRVERKIGGGYAIAARTFYQEVHNQLLALFGSADGGSLPGSHYHVGSLGDVDATGWGVSLSNAANRRVHGSIAYQMIVAGWLPFEGDPAVVGMLAPGALAERSSRFHDITTSVETEVPGSDTRVFVLYRIDTAFAKGVAEGSKIGLDGRFDVQVSQPLPLLDFTSAQWQAVFAVRNLFREITPGGSVYDELLVVRPPTRVVGGLVVRF